ncbi:MAG: hypothetical protein Ct9H300mP16_12180 [Pseudomonadota bacterium]|nr:MAG: hypothetical protein Ct9H300mP16_12180 [Pseudomonadota bacterium]
MPATDGSAAVRPKVYFEEWDDPQISAIRWVSELIGIAGGDDIFPELAACPDGKSRIVADLAKSSGGRQISSSVRGAAKSFAARR